MRVEGLTVLRISATDMMFSRTIEQSRFGSVNGPKEVKAAIGFVKDFDALVSYHLDK